MTIRAYAETIGFNSAGNLTYMGKWDISNRWYIDEEQNGYLVDIVLGTIRIIPHKKR